MVILLLSVMVAFGGKLREPQAAPTPVEPAGGVPTLYTPRLLLELPLGDAPDQPGRTSARVGGVTAGGPSSVAVTIDGTIWLADQAHGRLLRYQESRLTGQIAAPWLDDQGVQLLGADGHFIGVRSGGWDYVLGPDGKIDGRLAHPVPHPQSYPSTEKGTELFASLGDGMEYRRDGRDLLRIKGATGQVMARGTEPDLDVVDLYVGLEGGVYTLSWSAGLERAYVHEVLPPASDFPDVRVDPAVGPPLPPAFGLPVPASIQVRAPGWRPVTLTDRVTLHNLWLLLETATLFPDQNVKYSEEPIHLTADGTKIDLYGYGAVVDGRHYTYDGLPGPVGRLLYAALLQDVPAAFADASEVRLAIADLPGVERRLQPEQVKLLASYLADAYPVNQFNAPRPLEAPFPRYELRLKGQGWEAALVVQGSHHLMLGQAALAVSQADLEETFRTWLPVPALKPGELGYLYLAEQVETTPGGNVTRWKATFVRHLLGVRQPSCRGAQTEPYSVTFTVAGLPQAVSVDPAGFTYAGRRYDGSDLTCLLQLNGVP